MEEVESLLTPTESPYQIPTNLEELDKYTEESNIVREDMDELWSTENLLGQDERNLLVWHHRMNHCPFKYLLGISKRGIIPNNTSKVIKIPPCVTCLFGNYHKKPCSTKGKHSGGSISNHLETRPGAMTSIDHMVSAQPGIIPQVSGALTHEIFWPATVFLDHYSKYFYACFMRGTLDNETLQAKEVYDLLSATHGARVFAYRAENGRFLDSLFKEAFKTCVK